MARPSLGEDSLSLDVIARAALRIIDNEGADALNFRRLGKELGVAHMTVYRRLADSKVPLDGCVLDTWMLDPWVPDPEVAAGAELVAPGAVADGCLSQGPPPCRVTQTVTWRRAPDDQSNLPVSGL